MRLLGLGIAMMLFATLPFTMPSAARAEICALYADGTSDCYFTSKAQCMAGVRSRGGSCIERGNTATKPEKPGSRARTKPAAQ